MSWNMPDEPFADRDPASPIETVIVPRTRDLGDGFRHLLVVSSGDLAFEPGPRRVGLFAIERPVAGFGHHGPDLDHGLGAKHAGRPVRVAASGVVAVRSASGFGEVGIIGGPCRVSGSGELGQSLLGAESGLAERRGGFLGLRDRRGGGLVGGVARQEVEGVPGSERLVNDRDGPRAGDRGGARLLEGHPGRVLRQRRATDVADRNRLGEEPAPGARDANLAAAVGSSRDARIRRCAQPHTSGFGIPGPGS